MWWICILLFNGTSIELKSLSGHLLFCCVWASFFFSFFFWLFSQRFLILFAFPFRFPLHSVLWHTLVTLYVKWQFNTVLIVTVYARNVGANWYCFIKWSQATISIRWKYDFVTCWNSFNWKCDCTYAMKYSFILIPTINLYLYLRLL